MAQAKLEVTIISAENLYNADGFAAGKSDPYVICEVPGQPNMRFQTKTLNNTLNPVWNHVGEINGFMDGDTLEFQVWDSDTWPKSDDFLGKAVLTAADFYPNGLEGRLQLSESKTEAYLDVKVVVLETVDPQMEEQYMQQEGYVQEGYVQDQYVQEQQVMMERDMVVEGGMQMEGGMMEGDMVQGNMVDGGMVAEGGMVEGMMVRWQGPVMLTVNIMNARGLYNADGFLAGKSDPYCICLVPEKPTLKFQTRTINNCLDPEWNHVGQIQGFEAGDSLEFQVWDSDTFPKPDQLLGKVTLSPEDFENHPNGIEGVLQLAEGLSKDCGQLEICIQVDELVEDQQATMQEQPAQQQTTLQTTGAVQSTELQASTGSVKRLSAGSANIEKLAGAKTGKLKITIFSASGLYNADGFLAGKSDPYVICQVVEKPAKKFQTKVMANTLEPVWNHLGVINGFATGETLEFNVWDKDTFPKPDNLLGKVILASDEFFPAGLEGGFVLSESKAEGASLHIRVEVLPDAEAVKIPGSTAWSTLYQPGSYYSTYNQGGMVIAQAPPTYVTTAGGAGQYQYQYPVAQYQYPVAQYATTSVPAVSSTPVAMDKADAAFTTLDTNHDGVLSREEFSAGLQAGATETAAQPVATKVEYAAATSFAQASLPPTTVTYTTASSAIPTSPVTYTTAAPVPPIYTTMQVGTSPTVSSPVTYTPAEPSTGVTYTTTATAPASTTYQMPATEYKAPITTTYMAAPVTYPGMAAVAPTAVAPTTAPPIYSSKMSGTITVSSSAPVASQPYTTTAAPVTTVTPQASASAAMAGSGSVVIASGPPVVPAAGSASMAAPVAAPGGSGSAAPAASASMSAAAVSATAAAPVTYGAAPATPVTTIYSGAAPVTYAAGPMTYAPGTVTYMTGSSLAATASAQTALAGATSMTGAYTASTPTVSYSLPGASNVIAGMPMQTYTARAPTAGVTYAGAGVTYAGTAVPGMTTYAAPAGAVKYTMAPMTAAPAMSAFDRLDTNHDGVLTRTEFNAALQQ